MFRYLSTESRDRLFTQDTGSHGQDAFFLSLTATSPSQTLLGRLHSPAIKINSRLLLANEFSIGR